MLARRDQLTIWHPYTQHQMTDLQIPLIKGEGAYLYDENNKRYIDLISSWWVNLHGHAHPVIAKAIYDQALHLEHTIFSGFTHEPAVKLAEELLKILPNNLTKIFYTDNGSTAVEVAMKMAYQYWRNKGRPARKRFIAFENSYHGDTFGAMSLGKSCGFFSHFDDMLFTVDLINYPATWNDDKNVLQKEFAILSQLKNHLQKYANEIAALIVEPLVQGASGMHMCTPAFLKQLESLLQEYEVLMIYDEVMTGFGRTGSIYAAHKADTYPDIICMAKGITGGFLPLAATACTEEIYEAFLGNNFSKALAHGHSYTANPLGCAAGLASLSLLKDQVTIEQIKMIENIHELKLKEFEDLPAIEKIRYCGTIAAFDFIDVGAYGSNKSIALREAFMRSGLLLRPLGNVVYLLPPYCISESDLNSSYDIILCVMKEFG